MKHIIFSFITMSFFAACLFTSACKDKCPSCPQNAECNDGKCECESGYWGFRGNCIQLGDNSYIGTNTACYCYDTLALSISGQGDSRSLTMLRKEGGTSTQSVFYYELASGDSLYFPELDLRCFNAANVPMKPAIYGKKQPNGDWRIRLKFNNPLTGEFVDECTMTLNKFE